MILSRNWTRVGETQKMLSGKDGHNLFVYGSLQEPQVVHVLLDRVPDSVSAVFSGLFRIKGRFYPTILPDGTRDVTGKKFLEETRLPEAKTRMDTFKTFFQQDINNGRPLDS